MGNFERTGFGIIGVKICIEEKLRVNKNTRDLSSNRHDALTLRGEFLLGHSGGWLEDFLGFSK